MQFHTAIMVLLIGGIGAPAATESLLFHKLFNTNKLDESKMKQNPLEQLKSHFDGLKEKMQAKFGLQKTYPKVPFLGIRLAEQSNENQESEYSNENEDNNPFNKLRNHFEKLKVKMQPRFGLFENWHAKSQNPTLEQSKYSENEESEESHELNEEESQAGNSGSDVTEIEENHELNEEERQAGNSRSENLETENQELNEEESHAGNSRSAESENHEEAENSSKVKKTKIDPLNKLRSHFEELKVKMQPRFGKTNLFGHLHNPILQNLEAKNNAKEARHKEESQLENSENTAEEIKSPLIKLRNQLENSGSKSEEKIKDNNGDALNKLRNQLENSGSEDESTQEEIKDPLNKLRNQLENSERKGEKIKVNNKDALNKLRSHLENSGSQGENTLEEIKDPLNKLRTQFDNSGSKSEETIKDNNGDALNKLRSQLENSEDENTQEEIKDNKIEDALNKLRSNFENFMMKMQPRFGSKHDPNLQKISKNIQNKNTNYIQDSVENNEREKNSLDKFMGYLDGVTPKMRPIQLNKSSNFKKLPLQFGKKIVDSEKTKENEEGKEKHPQIFQRFGSFEDSNENGKQTPDLLRDIFGDFEKSKTRYEKEVTQDMPQKRGQAEKGSKANSNERTGHEKEKLQTSKRREQGISIESPNERTEFKEGVFQENQHKSKGKKQEIPIESQDTPNEGTEFEEKVSQDKQQKSQRREQGMSIESQESSNEAMEFEGEVSQDKQQKSKRIEEEIPIESQESSSKRTEFKEKQQKSKRRKQGISSDSPNKVTEFEKEVAQEKQQTKNKQREEERSNKVTEFEKEVAQEKQQTKNKQTEEETSTINTESTEHEEEVPQQKNRQTEKGRPTVNKENSFESKESSNEEAEYEGEVPQSKQEGYERDATQEKQQKSTQTKQAESQKSSFKAPIAIKLTKNYVEKDSENEQQSSEIKREAAVNNKETKQLKINDNEKNPQSKWRSEETQKADSGNSEETIKENKAQKMEESNLEAEENFLKQIDYEDILKSRLRSQETRKADSDNSEENLSSQETIKDYKENKAQEMEESNLEAEENFLKQQIDHEKILKSKWHKADSGNSEENSRSQETIKDYKENKAQEIVESNLKGEEIFLKQQTDHEKILKSKWHKADSGNSEGNLRNQENIKDYKENKAQEMEESNLDAEENYLKQQIDHEKILKSKWDKADSGNSEENSRIQETIKDYKKNKSQEMKESNLETEDNFLKEQFDPNQSFEEEIMQGIEIEASNNSEQDDGQNKEQGIKEAGNSNYNKGYENKINYNFNKTMEPIVPIEIQHQEEQEITKNVHNNTFYKVANKIQKENINCNTSPNETQQEEDQENSRNINNFNKKIKPKLQQRFGEFGLNSEGKLVYVNKIEEEENHAEEGVKMPMDEVLGNQQKYYKEELQNIAKSITEEYDNKQMTAIREEGTHKMQKKYNIRELEDISYGGEEEAIVKNHQNQEKLQNSPEEQAYENSQTSSIEKLQNMETAAETRGKDAEESLMQKKYNPSELEYISNKDEKEPIDENHHNQEKLQNTPTSLTEHQPYEDSQKSSIKKLQNMETAAETREEGAEENSLQKKYNPRELKDILNGGEEEALEENHHNQETLQNTPTSPREEQAYEESQKSSMEKLQNMETGAETRGEDAEEQTYEYPQKGSMEKLQNMETAAETREEDAEESSMQKKYNPRELEYILNEDEEEPLDENQHNQEKLQNTPTSLTEGQTNKDSQRSSIEKLQNRETAVETIEEGAEKSSKYNPRELEDISNAGEEEALEKNYHNQEKLQNTPTSLTEEQTYEDSQKNSIDKLQNMEIAATREQNEDIKEEEQNIPTDIIEAIEKIFQQTDQQDKQSNVMKILKSNNKKVVLNN